MNNAERTNINFSASVEIENNRIYSGERFFGEIIEKKEKLDHVASGNSNKPQTYYTIFNGTLYLSESGEWVEYERAKIFDFKKDIKLWLDNYFTGSPTLSLNLFPEFTVSAEDEQPPQEVTKNKQLNPIVQADLDLKLAQICSKIVSFIDTLPEAVDAELSKNLKAIDILIDFDKSGIPPAVALNIIDTYYPKSNPDDFIEIIKVINPSKIKTDGSLSSEDEDYYSFLKQQDFVWAFRNETINGEVNKFTCIRLSHPVPDQDGKPQRYINTAGIGTTPDSHYYYSPRFKTKSALNWVIQQIIQKQKLTLNPDDFSSYSEFYSSASPLTEAVETTEGAKKGVSLSCAGQLSLALTSINTWGYKRKRGLQEPSVRDKDGFRELHPHLESALKGAKKLIISYDFDVKHRSQQSVERECSGLAYKVEEKLKINTYRRVWERKQGKGIDDYLGNNYLLENTRIIPVDTIPYQEKVKKLHVAKPEKIDPREVTKKRHIFLKKAITQTFEQNLRFNELTMDLDEAIDLDLAYLELEEKQGISENKTKVADMITKIAMENSYHPVREYLEKCDHSTTPINIDNLASELWGNDNQLQNQMVKKTLISAVARVFNPGCKVDTCLVAKGDQGYYKSTFFQELFGDEWFTDSVNLQKANKDELLKAHQHWCCELAELETTTGKRAAGELKAHLSTRIDNFRRPYERKSKNYKRQHIYVASVNEDCFLTDSTGSRRFWVIEVNQRIDIFKLKQYRDAIWSAAVKAYKAGETWWFDYSDEALINEANKSYEHQDSWIEQIEGWINAHTEKDFTSTFELLTQALSFEPSRITKRDEMRISKIMDELGYKKIKKYDNVSKRQKRLFDLNMELDNLLANLKKIPGCLVTRNLPLPRKRQK